MARVVIGGSGPPRRHQRIAYLGCAFGVGAFGAFSNFSLSLWLTGFTTSYLLIGLLSNTRSLEGAVVSPVVGAWSDRVWAGWLGRRRPFILVGGLLSAALIALTPAIVRALLPAMPAWLPRDVASLAPVVAVIFLFTLTFNAMDDVYKALMVDLTEGAARNSLAAWRILVETGGQVTILVLAGLLSRDAVTDGTFVVAGLLMASGVLVTVLGLREPPPEAWEADRQAMTAEAGVRPSLLTIARMYPGAVVLCLTAFAYWAGAHAVLPLVSVYTRDILGASVGEAQILPALSLLSSTAFALPMAWLGTRYGKRRVISVGLAIIALAALAGLVITTKEQGAVLFVFAGVGNAALLVLTIPLLADLVPRHHMGAATGALAASGSVAAPVSSLVAGALADAYGPRAIFGVMAVMVCVALALVPAIRPRVATEEQTARLSQEYT